MKKILWGWLSALALWLALGVLAARVRFPLPSLPNPQFRGGPNDWAGSIHFHTVFSDGSGTVPEILAAARQAGLDFVIPTDHGAAPPAQIAEGRYDDGRPIFLLNGVELGGENGHRVQIGSWTEVAHPYHPIVPWKGEIPADSGGIEILNGSTFLQTALVKVLPAAWALLLYPFNPDYAFFATYAFPGRELQLWDRVNVKKMLVGLAATDAHAKIPLFGGKFIRFPSYARAFRAVKTHILADEDPSTLPFPTAKEVLYNSLRLGRAYFSLDLLADPRGFNFEAAHSGGVAGMGDRLRLKKGEPARFQVRLGEQLPMARKEVRILLDGRVAALGDGAELEWPSAEPGVYRAEVYLWVENLFGREKKMLWIGSNPIRIEP